MYKLITIVSLVLAFFVSIAWATEGRNQTWEYKLEYKVNERRANELGSQGWEMVGAGTENAGTITVSYLIFKRAK